MRSLIMLCLWPILVHAAFGATAAAPAPAPAADLRVGVYYYPGWRSDGPQRPWDRIQRFKEREPLLGWYEEGAGDVMSQQIDWMADAGLKYVVFDWYWDGDSKVQLDHALGAYFRAPNRSRLPFSIMWANHGVVPKSRANWDKMVDFWLRYYAQRPEMLRIDGKPVIFLFLARDLEEKAQKFGATSAQLLAAAQVKAREAGLPGLYFVAGATGEEIAVMKTGPATGYSAVTMYNLHRPPGIERESHSFRELDAAYRGHWKAYEANSPMPVFFPITAGWDKRPWGGSPDPRHDDSLAIPSEFEVHLSAAKEAMEKGKLRPGQSTRWGLICCWNEFGEGSYIEPTRQLGKAMLDKVRLVFGAGKPASAKE